jgi:hypothetical protein
MLLGSKTRGNLRVLNSDKTVKAIYGFKDYLVETYSEKRVKAMIGGIKKTNYKLEVLIKLDSLIVFISYFLI